MRVLVIRRLLACVTILAIFGMAMPASATLFYNETFSYSDGDLTTVSSGNWTAHSGAGNKPIQVSSGEISLDQSSGSGEDVNRPTGSTMGSGDKWYSAFDVTVSGGSGDVYFAHFKDAGNFFGSRLFITSPASGGDFRFALSGDGNLTDADGEAFWGSDLSFGATYRVVTSYDYDTGDGQLWVNPTTESSTSVTATDGFDSDAFITYAFRQATPSTGTSTQVIDNLCVATEFNQALNCVPEPSTVALVLLALGLVGLGRRTVR